MIRILPTLLILTACGQQPAAPPPPVKVTSAGVATTPGTVQTPVGVAIDRPSPTRQDVLTPGQWELASVTSAISGGKVSPEMKRALIGKTIAYDACIPADEAALPDANFFAGGSMNECKYTDHDWRNGKLSASIACNVTPGTITMRMAGTYDATTMVADATMTTSGSEGGNIVQKAQLKARRIGECRASQNTPR